MTLEGGKLMAAEYKATGRIHLPLTPYCWEVIGRMREHVRDASLSMRVRQIALYMLKGGEDLHGRDFTSDLPSLPELTSEERAAVDVMPI